MNITTKYTIARIIPDEVLEGALQSVAGCLVEEIAANITALWGLCPKEYYLEASEALLADKPEIKKQTDRYYKAQQNSLKNIQTLVDKGVEVYNIVDYDAPLYQIGTSWNEDNADGVIHLSSTAMGVHSAIVGETLGEDYKQANTSKNCSDPSHNHISPDNVVDASTGLLPDTTFYFDGQKHEQTALNTNILTLALRILENKITDVYSDPAYPQFISCDPYPAPEEGFFTKLSDFLYEYTGTNGFFELPGLAVKSIFQDIKNLFS